MVKGIDDNFLVASQQPAASISGGGHIDPDGRILPKTAPSMFSAPSMCPPLGFGRIPAPGVSAGPETANRSVTTTDMRTIYELPARRSDSSSSQQLGENFRE